MEHKIINKIKNNELKILKKCIGKKINKIIFDIPGGKFSLNTFLVLKNKNITLYNTIAGGTDMDEYPVFNIEYTKDITDFKRDYTNEGQKKYTIKVVDINDKLLKVEIIEDNVKWEFKENTWEVVADVAIKLYFKKMEALIVIKDTVASFMEVYTGEKLNTDSLLEGQWDFKVEEKDMKYFERNVKSL